MSLGYYSGLSDGSLISKSSLKHGMIRFYTDRISEEISNQKSQTRNKSSLT